LTRQRLVVRILGMLTLRPYQRAAVDALAAARDRGTLRPAVVLPTGAGKTVVFAHDIREWRGRQLDRGAPDSRVLVVAHRAELIEQAAGRLHDVDPSLRIGVVKAERNDTLADVVVASVQTLRSARRRAQLRRVGMLVVDECHHATAASYRDTLEHFGAFERTPAVGYTATMVRGDDAALGEVWQDVVYTRTIGDMIRDGYLVRPRGIRVKVRDLDFSRVRKVRGDYSEKDLGEAIEASMTPEAIARAYGEHCQGRQGLLFAPTVASAGLIAAALCEANIPTAVVSGETSDGERRAMLQRFRDGEIRVLATCMVLTEGTDLPMASVVVIARPTTHAGLYVQMVGRALRLWPGKDSALVLDVTGASQRHSLDGEIDLFGESDRDEDEEVNEDEEVLELPDDAVGMRDVLDEYVDGELEAVEVDLFRGSQSAWLRTRAGVWFLPAGERYIALVPAPRQGAWDVVAMHRYQTGNSRWVVRDIGELSLAMAHAESDVTPAEQVVSRRERAWRSKRPSSKQLDLAARYGIVVDPHATAGEVSGLISVVLASRRIDPRLPAHARRVVDASLAGVV